ncbi:BON domain-containing protein [Paraburkholderia sp. RP-4-7]|uniref:BON domain-containing protein n=1 Tax=Paraburkholderia polaris TaxID=2728848 RepID=A0A848IT07_9BURK|nr:BON domain-containing protein [Paraburkholderia polaris]NMM04216.1 BON domain-containing protein [Paraburkholderia polaris]
MGTSNVDDKQLAKDVRAALRRGKRSGYSFSNIRVRAKSGVVSLTGAVPAQTDVDAATRVTQAVPGVTAVDNRMTVHVPMNRYGGQ